VDNRRGEDYSSVTEPTGHFRIGPCSNSTCIAADGGA